MGHFEILKSTFFLSFFLHRCLRPRMLLSICGSKVSKWISVLCVGEDKKKVFKF
jgi:hypothetical protein